MGLDNGIIIPKTDKTKLFGLDDYFKTEYESSNNLEVLYWRKCWGIRNDVVNYLCDVYGTDRDCYSWILDDTDIKEIISIIKSWQNKKKWNMDGGSPIWTYKEVKDMLRDDIVDLTYLLAKMEDYKNAFKVEFYDSY